MVSYAVASNTCQALLCAGRRQADPLPHRAPPAPHGKFPDVPGLFAHSALIVHMFKLVNTCHVILTGLATRSMTHCLLVVYQKVYLYTLTRSSSLAWSLLVP